MSPTPEQIEELRKWAEEESKIVEELLTKDPTLPTLTAIVMANDIRATRRVREYVASGEYTPLQGINLTGSYERLNLALEFQAKGLITLDDLLDNLPDWWRGSDPDDTDPRFLLLWRAAKERNNRKYVRDGAPLPTTRKLRLYRGQRPTDPVGIAWSLDADIAHKFARGASFRVANLQGHVLVGIVERARVLAYLTGRGESEVIVDPADLTVYQPE